MLNDKIVQRVRDVPTIHLVCMLGLCYLMIFYSCWQFCIRPAWQRYHQEQRHLQRLTQQWQQAQQLLTQKKLLQQRWQMLVKSRSNDLGQAVTTTALANQILINDLVRVSDDQWQMSGSTTFDRLNLFLVQLWQQPLQWVMTKIELNLGDDHSIQWRLFWQKTVPELAQSPGICHLPPTSNTLSNPFQIHTAVVNDDLRQHNLAQLKWLGIFHSEQQSAALVQLEGFPPRLIRPGDVLGQERWRLVAVNRQRAEFVDAQNHSHQLALNLQGEFPHD